jgi:DNA mismatch endonuclease (patch repair protein)
MRKARERDTAPERALRTLLHRRGLRYRVDRAPLPDVRRRADLVFGPAKVAVFVDGCFWHGCPKHASWPRTNAKWWRDKIGRNQERDRDTDRLFTERGWAVVRIWEHEDAVEAADRVAALVAARQLALTRR